MGFGHHSVGKGHLVLPIVLIIIQWLTSKHPVEARPAPKVPPTGKKVTTLLKIDVQGHKALQQNVTTAEGYADLASRIAGTMEKMDQHVKVRSDCVEIRYRLKRFFWLQTKISTD